MKTRVVDFLKERKSTIMQNSRIVYLCLAGSNVIGTAEEDSDTDVRAVVQPSQDSQYGLNDFSHSKVVEGLDGINKTDDLDIEIFSVRKYIQSLYAGEVVTVEMLHAPTSAVIEDTGDLDELQEVKDIFLTKKLAKNYNNFAFGLWRKSMYTNEKGIKSSQRLERVTTHGYDTKYAMKSLLYFTMAEEILSGMGLKIDRPEAEKLKAIKKGLYTREEMDDLLRTLNNGLKEKLESSTLPEKPDFDMVNRLCVKLTKELAF